MRTDVVSLAIKLVVKLRLFPSQPPNEVVKPVQNMQIKAIVVAASLGLLAVATPSPQNGPQCTTGSLECCESVESSNDPVVSTILALLDIVLGPIGIPVGLTCSPVTVGVGGASGCSETLVCCEDNSFNGVVAIGCTPVSVNV